MKRVPVISGIVNKSQVDICFDRVIAIFLKDISHSLAEQTDAASFMVSQIEQCSGTMLYNVFHGGFELIAAVAFFTAKDITCMTDGVHAD
ncbi:hypothetical protein D3C71_1556480 [compost metagenome]